MKRRRLAAILACVALVPLSVAARGWVLAHRIGGRYPLSSFLLDALSLAILLAALHAFDLCLRKGVRRVLGASTRTRRFAAGGVRILVLILVIGPLLLATVQLHPQRVRCDQDPMSLGMQFSEVSLASDGGTLSGWYIPGTEDDAPIVVIAHGFEANKANFLPAAAVVYDIGYSAFLFDFRGHGDSEGHTTTLGYREADDVKAAYDWCVQSHPGRRVYALGYSMGGAAVARAASMHGIFEKIVLDSTFARLEHVARGTVLRHTGPLASPLWQASRFWGWVWTGVDLDRLRPAEWMASLAGRPVLLIHGTSDSVIPCSESQALFEASERRASLWMIQGADHVEGMAREGYGARLKEFYETGK